MIFCPGMGPLDHTWFSLFAGPTYKKFFLEKIHVRFN